MAKAKRKFPKEVAGVKVPKTLRKEAKKALKLADSPAVRELAAVGLSLAAQALIDRSQPRSAAQPATRDRSGHRGTTAALKANLDALNLGDVLRAAAAEGARRFLEGFDEGKHAAPAKAKPAPRPARAKAPAKPTTAKPAAAKAATKPAAAKTAPKPARAKPAAKAASTAKRRKANGRAAGATSA